MARLARLISFAIYITGIVIAKGFWLTTFAVFIPPYSWYLVIERLVEKFL